MSDKDEEVVDVKVDKSPDKLVSSVSIAVLSAVSVSSKAVLRLQTARAIF
jgi:hypothetical protein